MTQNILANTVASQGCWSQHLEEIDEGASGVLVSEEGEPDPDRGQPDAINAGRLGMGVLPDAWVVHICGFDKVHGLEGLVTLRHPNQAQHQCWADYAACNKVVARNVAFNGTPGMRTLTARPVEGSMAKV